MWAICELFGVTFLANIFSLDWPLATDLSKITSQNWSIKTFSDNFESISLPLIRVCMESFLQKIDTVANGTFSCVSVKKRNMNVGDCKGFKRQNTLFFL